MDKKIKDAKGHLDAIEPIFKINEFEEAAGAILDLAKDQTIRNIQKAKDKAAEIIQEEKNNIGKLEKEYLDKIEEEIKIEKAKLVSKGNEQLQLIKSIPNERIEKAVSYILERILPTAETL